MNLSHWLCLLVIGLSLSRLMKSKLFFLLMRLALTSLARNQLLPSISLKFLNLIFASIPRSKCVPTLLQSCKPILLRLNTVLLTALTRSTITTMEVIVSSTIVVEVAAISLAMVVVVVATMVMVVDSLTLSVKSIINMVMWLPIAITGMMITMSLLNQWPIQIRISTQIKITIKRTNTQTNTKISIPLTNIQTNIPLNLPIHILISLHIGMLHLNAKIHHHKLI